VHNREKLFGVLSSVPYVSGELSCLGTSSRGK
jgi:hypothetical protein